MTRVSESSLTAKTAKTAKTAVNRSSLPWRSAIVVLAVLLTYANSINGPFVFDDISTVVDNPAIRDLRPTAVFSIERERPVAGRPLVNASFALNYAVSGLRVPSYHAVNILLHAACALMLLALLKRLLAERAFGSVINAHALDFAFAATLVWAVHPINSEVVDYLTQRTESMMALLYLSTMYAAIRAERSSESAKWSAAAVVCCALGMACKESMVTAPLMVPLFDRAFAFTTWKKAAARRWPLYAGLAATWLIVVVLQQSGPRMHSAGFASGVTPWTYLLNQSVMIVQYLRLAVWPRALVLNYGPPVDLSLSSVLPQAVLVVALLALTVVALRRWPAYGFLGAWFFVTLAPTSSIIPISTEVGAERRMYLPMIAVCVLAVLAAQRAWAALAARFDLSSARAARIAAVAGVAVVTGSLAVVTALRNRDYRSGVTMARTVVDRWPTAAAHAILGVSLEAEQRHEEALPELRQGTAGGYSRAYFHLGGALFNHGDTAAAIPALETFLRLEPDLEEVVTARMLLARAYADQRRFADATIELRQVLRMRPSNVDALGLLADSLFAQQKLEESIAIYTSFLASRPNDVGALINLGVANASLGRARDARAAFERGLAVNPKDVRIHRNLAALALNVGDVEGGRQSAARAVESAPNDAESHDLLGRALAMSGRSAEAKTEFERALTLDPSFDQARNDLEILKRSR
ncbi:MAG TPA: tetratricopeptide repeat protein [Vicinamibacterales bacterium]